MNGLEAESAVLRHTP